MDRTKLFRDPSKDDLPLPNQIGFKFKSKASLEKRNKNLKRIRSWKAVVSVEQVFKDINMDLSESMMGLYILFVRKSEQAESTLKKLQVIPEIEYAYIPSGRSPK